MGTPVPRVANQRQLLSALPSLDEKRPASDRPARLRIVDPVPPEGGEVLAGESVVWENYAEEGSPACEACTEDNSDRFRAESADTLNHSHVDGQVAVRVGA